MSRPWMWLLLPVLAGCGHRAAADHVVLEQMRAAPLEFSVQGEGDLQSSKPTPLLVPGSQFTLRQLNWMVPDGSIVRKGELVARFSAQQSKQDLAQARIDLQRNTLARATKQAELANKRGQLGVDLTEVAVQYAIAERYANAPLEAMARNDILDAVQDVHYLGVRQHILHAREDQSSASGNAELAVLDAQRHSFDTVAAQKQADLAALELRAPHAGVLVMGEDWTGQTPHVGSNLFAGNPFATLPDLSALEVRLSVPQIEAQGIQVGDKVELHRWGAPTQTVTARISWIASAAQPKSRTNPVKYLAMKVALSSDTARRHGWIPGQRFVGKIILLQVDKGYSVPNLALGSDADGASTVQLLVDGKAITRKLTLGVRGATRSQVLAGLHAGDRVLLATGNATEAK
ncbi:MAG TPA: efflux RND transporter periplasmic adaptor subunit [Rhodanobacter sp.]|nr:efflux RND transporter periplasmic adaptor subunit [Rhodanobacter sp.]